MSEVMGWIHSDVPLILHSKFNSHLFRNVGMAELKCRCDAIASNIAMIRGADFIRYSVYPVTASQWTDKSRADPVRVFFVIDQIGNPKQNKSLSDECTNVIKAYSSSKYNCFAGIIKLYESYHYGNLHTRVMKKFQYEQYDPLCESDINHPSRRNT